MALPKNSRTFKLPWPPIFSARQLFFAIIEPLFPGAGNQSKWEKRKLVDAVLYFVDNGCKWRNLPHDFPPYTTVANFYHAAIRSGLWKKIRAALGN